MVHNKEEKKEEREYLKREKMQKKSAQQISIIRHADIACASKAPIK